MVHFSTGFSCYFSPSSNSDIESFEGIDDSAFVNGEKVINYINNSYFDNQTKKKLRLWVRDNDYDYVKKEDIPYEISDVVCQIRLLRWPYFNQNDVYEKLVAISDNNEVDLPNFEDFKYDDDGTQQLLDHLQSNLPNFYDKDRLILGCLIYHQFNYTGEIYAFLD